MDATPTDAELEALFFNFDADIVEDPGVSLPSPPPSSPSAASDASPYLSSVPSGMDRDWRVNGYRQSEESVDAPVVKVEEDAYAQFPSLPTIALFAQILASAQSPPLSVSSTSPSSSDANVPISISPHLIDTTAPTLASVLASSAAQLTSPRMGPLDVTMDDSLLQVSVAQRVPSGGSDASVSTSAPSHPSPTATSVFHSTAHRSRATARSMSVSSSSDSGISSSPPVVVTTSQRRNAATASHSRRKVALSEDQKAEKIKERMQRNRMAAQESRDRKKMYFRNLESTNEHLASENAQLAQRVADLEQLNHTLAARLSDAISWAASVAATAIVPATLAPTTSILSTPASPPLSTTSSTPSITLPHDAFLPPPSPLAGLGDPAEVPAGSPDAFSLSPHSSPRSPSPVPVLLTDLALPLDDATTNPRAGAALPYPAGALPLAFALHQSRSRKRNAATAWLDARFPVFGAIVGVVALGSSMWDVLSSPSERESSLLASPSQQRTPASTSPSSHLTSSAASSPSALSSRHSLDLVLDPTTPAPPTTLVVSALLAILASWSASMATRGTAGPSVGSWTAVRAAATAARVGTAGLARLHGAVVSPVPLWMMSNSALLRPLRRSARFVPLLALHNTFAIILTPLVPRALLASAYQATTSSVSHSRTARTSFWNLCRPLVASQVARQAQHLGSSKFGRWGSQFGTTSTEGAGSRSGGASRGGARWSLGSMGIDWYAGRQAALAPVTVAMTSDRRGCFENAWRSNGGRGMATRAGEVPMVVGKFGRGV